MILHLVSAADWAAAAANKPYLPKAFERDGFIHATFGDALLLKVANRFYRSEPGEFLAVAIDEHRIAAPVKWEPPADPPAAPAAPPPEAPAVSDAVAEFGDAEFGQTDLPETPAPAPVPADDAVLFPHIYGPLNRDAIMGIRRLLREADGRFVGYAPLADGAPSAAAATPVPADPANPLNLKPASQMANELVDATDQFSQSLDRLKDSIEARMAEIDKKIAKL